MNSSKTVNDWLSQATKKLHGLGIESAQLDALILLEDELGTNRAHLLTHPEIELTHHQEAQLERKLELRANREPLAYIRGHVEFYGRDFMVNKHVLVPRPESESFISLLLEKHKGIKTLLDVGTGSGILGITAKMELPQLQVTLSDNNKSALNVAAKNAQLLGVKVSLKQQNLIGKVNNYNAVFANLPYVPTGMVVEKELLYEPSAALYSGTDGMGHYRQLWQQINDLAKKPQFVFTEGLASQHSVMNALAEHTNYTHAQTDGLVQLFSLKA